MNPANQRALQYLFLRIAGSWVFSLEILHSKRGLIEIENCNGDYIYPWSWRNALLVRSDEKLATASYLRRSKGHPDWCSSRMFSDQKCFGLEKNLLNLPPTYQG
jgi:hypothetical protein